MEVRAEQEVCIAADVFRHSVCEKKLLNVASVRLMAQENARVYFSQIDIMQLCNIIHFHHIGMFLFLFSTVAKRVVSMQSQSRAPFSLSIPPCSPAHLRPESVCCYPYSFFLALQMEIVTFPSAQRFWENFFFLKN